jgi:endonuclease YncB( thermonuclease family)
MPSPYFFALRGRLKIEGKQPDGDSVRFIADNRRNYDELERSERIQPTRSDGSVQLRFEGVDAPEVHYGKASQPLGVEVRDDLLAWLGFMDVTYSPDGVTVVSGTPDTVRAAILSQIAEVNGRPVAYLLVDQDDVLPADGTWVHVDDALLDRTVNARLLREGLAYLTLYTSSPKRHRRRLRAIAAEARSAGRGVWAMDDTVGWLLTEQDDIGPKGQLILPKLFRRCTDYLTDVERGFDGNLVDWLLDVSLSPARDENDRVVVGGRIEVPLSSLLLQRNNRIAFQPDVLDVVFVEK